jgi:hypothetical protein
MSLPMVQPTERPSAIDQMKGITMQHRLVLVIVPLFLCCKTVNARHGRQQVFFGFLVVDTIPYVMTGTCSTECNVGLIFCC